ncbi:MAG: hypothetical protein ACT4NV_04885 [Rhodoferax sp.]
MPSTLAPLHAQGSALCLGDADPNTDARFGLDYHARAQEMTQGQERFWRIPATPLRYSSGAEGATARLHLYASGGRQEHSWQDGKGYLGNPRDVKNQEFTVVARVGAVVAPRSAQLTLKIRGGQHSAKAPQRASSTMMSFGMAPLPGALRFGKELTHPLYDYVVLPTHLPLSLEPGRWYGLKLQSFQRPAHTDRVDNRLYLLREPWAAQAGPWELLGEYTDVAGQPTGRYYQTLADWGGWQTTLRMDGFEHLDVAYACVQEISPPHSR